MRKLSGAEKTLGAGCTFIPAAVGASAILLGSSWVPKPISILLMIPIWVFVFNYVSNAHKIDMF